VEVIISAGLLSFLALTATFFWVDNFRLVQTVNADSAAIADGRASLERLTREIREVKYDNARGVYCVTTPFSATQMVFTKTSGGYDRNCGTNDFAVTVQWNTPNLNLTYAGTPAAPVTSFASDFVMLYLRADGVTPATNGAGLRFVQLTLAVQPPAPPGGQAGQLTRTSTIVALRNQ